MTTKTHLTLDDFLALPGIEEQRLELIDGEVCEKAPRQWGQAALVGEVGFALRRFGVVGASPRAIIPASPSWGPSAPLPDLALYKSSRPKSDEWMTSPPDLVVELLSIGQSRTEMRAKASIYLEFGVPCVWVFDLERQTVDVYEAGERLTLSASDALSCATLPGFTERIGDLLARAGFEVNE